MGLLYPFPVTSEETDRIDHTSDGTIILKSYGLPMIFWGYLAAILIVVITMGLLVSSPLEKLYQSDDKLNQALALAVYIVLWGIPACLLIFYFFEKCISKKGSELTLTYRVFWCPILKRRFMLDDKDPFLVKHFLDSPNIARTQKKPELRAFENQGYFQLWIKTNQGKFIQIDRHSRKADLLKMQALLSKY